MTQACVNFKNTTVTFFVKENKTKKRKVRVRLCP